VGCRPLKWPMASAAHAWVASGSWLLCHCSLTGQPAPYHSPLSLHHTCHHCRTEAASFRVSAGVRGRRSVPSVLLVQLPSEEDAKEGGAPPAVMHLYRAGGDCMGEGRLGIAHSTCLLACQLAPLAAAGPSRPLGRRSGPLEHTCGGASDGTPAARASRLRGGWASSSACRRAGWGGSPSRR